MFQLCGIERTGRNYEEFNGDNPFDPIKLEGALLNPDDYDAGKHGVLSAVITYHTPFQLSNGSKLQLAFALGQDMSVDSIIGIPLIKELKLELRFAPDLFLSHALKKHFSVIYTETKLTRPKLDTDSDKAASKSPTNESTSFKNSIIIAEPLKSILHKTSLSASLDETKR